MFNKTNFAIGLLLEAYAEEGQVNIVQLAESLAGRIGAVAKDFGRISDDDDEVLILNREDKMSMPLFETIADIAYIAGKHGYYSGNSREDMQHFIYLAKQFEKQYEGRDWNDLQEGEDDYMDAIDDFIILNIAVDIPKKKETLAFDYPLGVAEPWDNIEIAPCKEDDAGTYRLDGDTDDKPDFWSVYVHRLQGGAMCIADLPTQKAANDFAELLHNAILTFKDEGHMPMVRNKKALDEFNKFIDQYIERYRGTGKLFFHELESVKLKFNSLIKK